MPATAIPPTAPPTAPPKADPPPLGDLATPDVGTSCGVCVSDAGKVTVGLGTDGVRLGDCIGLLDGFKVSAIVGGGVRVGKGVWGALLGDEVGAKVVGVLDGGEMGGNERTAFVVFALPK